MAKSRSSPRYTKLRELLIDARKQKGLSQVELASALGKPQSYVSKFETGERRLDVVELIEVMSKLDCSVGDLLNTLMATRR